MESSIQETAITRENAASKKKRKGLKAMLLKPQTSNHPQTSSAGDDWEKSLLAAVEKCDVLLAIISETYGESGWSPHMSWVGHCFVWVLDGVGVCD